MKFFVAARTSALLSLLFLAVYGSINWFSSQRSDVGTLYFEWERYIPFVPWMIVPYMSIDLFFIAAPFLCNDRAELRALSRRIPFAIVVAGICFLLFPLRFALERPSAEGWLGMVFDWFRSMDQPYNLLPSLHIALRTILAATYVRHTKRLLRMASHVWFSLIGISTVLTHQHHVLDDREATEAVRRGVTAVLDLTAEFSEAKAFLTARYLNVPILDLTAPSQEQLRQMTAFIAEQSTQGKIGYSRSAAAVAAFLLKTGCVATVEEAVATLRRARPSIVVPPEVIAALAEFKKLSWTLRMPQAQRGAFYHGLRSFNAFRMARFVARGSMLPISL
jgi:hypothetical protein